MVENASYEYGHCGSVEFLRWPALKPLQAVVTTRLGGVSTGSYESLNLGLHVGDDATAVVENRERAARAIDLSIDDLVFCNQAHGRKVAVVGAADRGRGARVLETAIDGVDALVTAEPGVGLVVMVADCVPIVIHDPTAGVLACVHAGWGGTVALVSEAAISAMVELGACVDRMVVGVGPAVSPAKYQVGDEVASAARDAFGPRADRVLTDDGGGKWLFDLWTANVDTLLASGVLRSNVQVARVPTGGVEFFSDRSERPCGRSALLATM